jgi:hypothetical protein
MLPRLIPQLGVLGLKDKEEREFHPEKMHNVNTSLNFKFKVCVCVCVCNSEETSCFKITVLCDVKLSGTVDRYQRFQKFVPLPLATFSSK